VLLAEYFLDSKEFKNKLGIKSKTGWELELDIPPSELKAMINIMEKAAADKKDK
jgi:hypothetical protein